MRVKYVNLDGVENQKTLSDMRRWQRERKSKKKDMSVHIPYAERNRLDEVLHNKTGSSLTWIGHSTFLIQMQGVTILTDPVWANRMGLQQRLTRPGIPLQDMPEIDIVVISHGHYDHLDFPTLRNLRGKPLYLVPAGLKRLFERKGFHNVQELHWWEHTEHRGIEFHFVPAQHWTRRSLFDMNTSHWGGWILKSHTETVYFVGDTGYFRGFQLIAEKFQIDTVLMPIGAYEPEWFMKVSHINPEDAVKAFLELGAKRFVPMHYGAYRLADDTGPEALDRLHKEWQRLQLPAEKLMVLSIGETRFQES